MPHAKLQTIVESFTIIMATALKNFYELAIVCGSTVFVPHVSCKASKDIPTRNNTPKICPLYENHALVFASFWQVIAVCNLVVKCRIIDAGNLLGVLYDVHVSQTKQKEPDNPMPVLMQYQFP
jgi:hypothetical protein